MAFVACQRIFCCISSSISSKSDVHSDAGVIDETSRLIPATEEPSRPTVMNVDYGRLKGKLGTIVRAKEGRMVNVNAHGPFNLQNHPSTSYLPETPSSLDEPVDRNSLSQAYPEQHIPDIDSFMRPGIYRHPSSDSRRSNGPADYPSNPIFSARIVSVNGIERTDVPQDPDAVPDIPKLDVGSLSRSWGD
ncbi:uncharacterized protein BT62DRAFT_930840 [Guyanagaster necrorhizus]|uniref:Uncharacterized protein n=1 Tax=Guyanagaster necrorhizus TaxID=856835 RepID=A0A9P8AU95_9AGAR|nr:uncharacterized protein BT62DRAFT_930840 [Guyanagaster necrorhizus MCA 3950]KAG7447801.1 hypothetical protein BT62DRAFT_930840 [Guyanagaster necrorhizus MCA 3950]